MQSHGTEMLAVFDSSGHICTPTSTPVCPESFLGEKKINDYHLGQTQGRSAMFHHSIIIYFRYATVNTTIQELSVTGYCCQYSD